MLAPPCHTPQPTRINSPHHVQTNHAVPEHTNTIRICGTRQAARATAPPDPYVPVHPRPTPPLIHSHHPIAALAQRAHAPPTPARTPQAWHLRRTISSTRERQWARALPLVSWRQTIRGKPTGGLCSKRGDKYFRKIVRSFQMPPSMPETNFV